MNIGIIGGGPAGCALAYFLKREKHHNITIYEREQVVGGCCQTRFFDSIPYEFGPQILFTDKEWIKEFFSRWLKNKLPRGGEYYYLCSIDGELDNMHNFPITPENILKLPAAEKIIYELYQVDPCKPDYGNLEDYCISRVGKTLYETYLKNYNRKAWCRDPRDIDCDWVAFRPLALAEKRGRFGNQWAGHPGNYNPLWEDLAKDAKIVNGNVTVDADFNFYSENCKIIDDIVFSTISLNDELEFIDTCKIYVVLKSEKTLFSSCFNTFPNNFNFVRAFEYRLQYEVESEYTLIDFAFPTQGEIQIDDYIREVKGFCKDKFGLDCVEIWADYRKRIYPVASKKNMVLYTDTLNSIKHKPVIPLGRAGFHAYISKDTCIRMAREIADGLDELLNPNTKIEKLKKIRLDMH